MGRPKKTLWSKVITQANYFHRNKLTLSLKRLCKATGQEEGSSSVGRYAQALRTEGYLEDIKPGVFKVLKEVPSDLTCT